MGGLLLLFGLVSRRKALFQTYCWIWSVFEIHGAPGPGQYPLTLIAALGFDRKVHSLMMVEIPSLPQLLKGTQASCSLKADSWHGPNSRFVYWSSDQNQEWGSRNQYGFGLIFLQVLLYSKTCSLVLPEQRIHLQQSLQANLPLFFC